MFMIFMVYEFEIIITEKYNNTIIIYYRLIDKNSFSIISTINKIIFKFNLILVCDFQLLQFLDC